MIMYINEIRNQFEEQFWLEHFSATIKNSKGKLLYKSIKKQSIALVEHLLSNGYNAWTGYDGTYVEISDEDYVFGVLSHE